MQSNEKAGISFAQPLTLSGRNDLAEKCCAALHMTIPLVVDTLDDKVGHAYSGMPDRLYLIDRDGKIAYKGGRGPFGFKPGELEQAIVMNLLDEPAPARLGGRPVDADVWAKLPRPIQSVNAPLPAWAKELASSLPKTTAAMLELDYLHRTKSPLDPKLRAKLRWVAAQVNGSAYGMSYALADLRRTGANEEEIRQLQGDPGQWPASERGALEFARKLTKEAYKVQDEEVADLRRRHGDASVVAMVL